MADDAVFDIRGDFGPRVIGNGFAPAYGAVGEGDFAELDNAPMRQPVLDMLIGVVGKRNVQVDEFDGLDLHGELLWEIVSEITGYSKGPSKGRMRLKVLRNRLRFLFPP